MDFTPLLKRLGLYGKIILQTFKTLKLTKKQKVLLGAGLTYLISPIDLIPGFIPILGQLDDIIVTLTILVKILKELSAEDRDAYLQKFAVTLDMIEDDLKLAKELACQITQRAVGTTARLLYSGGKLVYGIASHGALAMAKIAFNR